METKKANVSVFIILLTLAAVCSQDHNQGHNSPTAASDITPSPAMHGHMHNVNNHTSTTPTPSVVEDSNNQNHNHDHSHHSPTPAPDIHDMTGHVHNSSNSTGSSTPQAGSLNHDHHHPMESTTESHHHDSDSPAGPPSHDHKPPSDKPPIISDGSVDHSKHDNTHAQANSEHAGHGGGGHSGGHYGFFHLTSNTVLLFKEWTTSTWQEILGASFAFGFATIFYEGLKAFRQFLLEKSRKPAALITSKPSVRHKICTGMHLLQSLLHIVQVVYAYMLMLGFMSFNGWICTAIAIGSGIGYFIFSYDRHQVEDANEHCM